MTQLILDTAEHNLSVPESIKGGYTAKREPLSEEISMISGRLVRELRGNVWMVSYQYGYFDDEMKNKVIAICEKGKKEAINCGFLPPESGGELTYSDFLVTEFSYPKFMWSRKTADGEGNYTPIPMWADFSITLREVKPSD